MVVKVCDGSKLPLFVGNTDQVPQGAIAALGFDYFAVGHAAGKKAAMILKGGKKAGDIPSGLAEDLTLFINTKAAAKQGVTVSQKYIDEADKVFK